MLNAGSQFRACRRARRQIRKRTDQLIQESRAGHPPQQAVFAIWQLDSADAPFTEHERLEGYIVGDNRVVIGESTYRLHSGKLPEDGTTTENYHFALPVSETKWAVPGTQAGDYVFIRQQWQVDEEKMGVVWEPGDGWIAVGFKRGNDDKILFYPLRSAIIDGAKPTPGDPNGKVKGYITALLKPEK
jgi:hypothetical protein